MPTATTSLAAVTRCATRVASAGGGEVEAVRGGSSCEHAVSSSTQMANCPAALTSTTFVPLLRSPRSRHHRALWFFVVASAPCQLSVLISPRKLSREREHATGYGVSGVRAG